MGKMRTVAFVYFVEVEVEDNMSEQEIIELAYDQKEHNIDCGSDIPDVIEVIKSPPGVYKGIIFDASLE